MTSCAAVLHGGPPWGFSISEFTPRALVVGSVNSDGKALKAGLAAGDHVVELNGISVATMSTVDVRRILRRSGGPLQLRYNRRIGPEQAKPAAEQVYVRRARQPLEVVQEDVADQQEQTRGSNVLGAPPPLGRSQDSILQQMWHYKGHQRKAIVTRSCYGKLPGSQQNRPISAPTTPSPGHPSMPDHKVPSEEYASDTGFEQEPVFTADGQVVFPTSATIEGMGFRRAYSLRSPRSIRRMLARSSSLQLEDALEMEDTVPVYTSTTSPAPAMTSSTSPPLGSPAPADPSARPDSNLSEHPSLATTALDMDCTDTASMQEEPMEHNPLQSQSPEQSLDTPVAAESTAEYMEQQDRTSVIKDSSAERCADVGRVRLPDDGSRVEERLPASRVHAETTVPVTDLCYKMDSGDDYDSPRGGVESPDRYATAPSSDLPSPMGVEQSCVNTQANADTSPRSPPVLEYYDREPRRLMAQPVMIRHIVYSEAECDSDCIPEEEEISPRTRPQRDCIPEEEEISPRTRPQREPCTTGPPDTTAEYSAETAAPLAYQEDMDISATGLVGPQFKADAHAKAAMWQPTNARPDESTLNDFSYNANRMEFSRQFNKVAVPPLVGLISRETSVNSTDRPLQMSSDSYSFQTTGLPSKAINGIPPAPPLPSQTVPPVKAPLPARSAPFAADEPRSTIEYLPPQSVATLKATITDKLNQAKPVSVKNEPPVPPEKPQPASLASARSETSSYAFPSATPAHQDLASPIPPRRPPLPEDASLPSLSPRDLDAMNAPLWCPSFMTRKQPDAESFADSTVDEASARSYLNRRVEQESRLMERSLPNALATAQVQEFGIPLSPKTSAEPPPDMSTAPNAHSWYRNMYKQLHTLDRKDESILKYRMRDYWNSVDGDKQKAPPPARENSSAQYYLSEPEFDLDEDLTSQPNHFKRGTAGAPAYGTLPARYARRVAAGAEARAKNARTLSKTPPPDSVVKCTPADYRLPLAQPRPIQEYSPPRQIETPQSTGKGLDNTRSDMGNDIRQADFDSQYRHLQKGGDVPYGGLAQLAPPERSDSYSRFAVPSQHHPCCKQLRTTPTTSTAFSPTNSMQPPITCQTPSKVYDNVVFSTYRNYAGSAHGDSAQGVSGRKANPPPPETPRRMLQYTPVPMPYRSKSSLQDYWSSRKTPEESKPVNEPLHIAPGFVAELKAQLSAREKHNSGSRAQCGSPVLSTEKSSGRYAQERAKVRNFHIPYFRADSLDEMCICPNIALLEPDDYLQQLRQICEAERPMSSASCYQRRQANTNSAVEELYEASRQKRSQSLHDYARILAEAETALSAIESISSPVPRPPPRAKRSQKPAEQQLIKRTSMYRSQSMPIVTEETVPAGSYIVTNGHRQIVNAKDSFEARTMIQRQFAFPTLMTKYKHLDSTGQLGLISDRRRAAKLRGLNKNSMKKVKSLTDIREEDTKQAVSTSPAKSLHDIPTMVFLKAGTPPFECFCASCRGNKFVVPHHKEVTVIELPTAEYEYDSSTPFNVDSLDHWLSPLKPCLRRYRSEPALHSGPSTTDAAMTSVGPSNAVRSTTSEFSAAAELANGRASREDHVHAPQGSAAGRQLEESLRALARATEELEVLPLGQGQQNQPTTATTNSSVDVYSMASTTRSTALSSVSAAANRQHLYTNANGAAPATADTPRQYARAMYRFAAMSPRELSFSRGDILTIRRQIDANWFEAELRGRVGIVPSNYVKLTDVLDRPPSVNRSVPPVIPPPTVTSTTHRLAQALFDFMPRNPSELRLVKGEEITLLHKVDDIWWQGKDRTGRSGLFPGSYIRIIEPSHGVRGGAISNHKLPAQYSSEMSISHRRTPVNDFSSRLLIDEQPYKSREFSRFEQRARQSQSVPRDQPLASPSRAPTSPVLGSRPSRTRTVTTNSRINNNYSDIETCQAVFPYAPAAPDELELREGDVVMVVERCDDGWMIGTSLRSGRHGTFPGNYVQAL